MTEDNRLNVNRQSVKSSNIATIDYCPTRKVLEVEFKNGGVYHHADVPNGAYDDLMAVTTSHGKHYIGNVRGKFQHTKV